MAVCYVPFTYILWLFTLIYAAYRSFNSVFYVPLHFPCCNLLFPFVYYLYYASPRAFFGATTIYTYRNFQYCIFKTSYLYQCCMLVWFAWIVYILGRQSDIPLIFSFVVYFYCMSGSWLCTSVFCLTYVYLWPLVRATTCILYHCDFSLYVSSFSSRQFFLVCVFSIIRSL